MTDRDQLIRERAYHLWERAGRPEQSEQDFWHRAEAEIASEQESGDGAEPLLPASARDVEPETAQKQAEPDKRARAAATPKPARKTSGPGNARKKR
jgi:hypothetical protein